MVDLPKDICCGCGGCSLICPVKCISMESDKYGFIYPKVDKKKCIQCGACNKICQYYYPVILHTPIKTIAAKYKDENNLLSVASGGLATLLAQKIIKDRGTVYGCQLENVEKINHISCNNIKDLDKIKGSKYIQSDLKESYVNIRKDLINNKKVLFIGTPCQVGGLKSFLKKDYENLLTVDLICHGVPSKFLLKNYIESCTKLKNYNFNNLKVFFRWKNFKKRESIQFGTRFVNEKNRIIKTYSQFQSQYMAAFFSGLSYRENCHECIYAKKERCSDITLGDFWGLGNKIETHLDTSKGVSLVLINSLNGQDIFESIKPLLDFEYHNIEDACRFNKNLNYPTPRPQDKTKFLNCCINENFRCAVNKYLPSFKKEKTIKRRIYLYFASKFYYFKKNFF